MRRVRAKARVRMGIGEKCLRPIVDLTGCSPVRREPILSVLSMSLSNCWPSYSKLSSQDKTRWKARVRSMDAEVIGDRRIVSKSVVEGPQKIRYQVTKVSWLVNIE